MESATRTGICRDATTIHIHELVRVRVLNENVGTTVVQTMADVKHRSSPHKWAKPDGPVAGPESENRLRLGYGAWKTLQMGEGFHVALASLLGGNPRLDEHVPVLYIQQNRSREALGAAEAFVNDTHGA